ncbi:hypothetical protein Ga0466249_002235 [Sporomusaceae bacterium BoRhaA]|uniref:hypothetical protein n=1 Tax=Pelorhabdus rhamnosifermentans TaxID=2772457 RepID=UPI001C0643F5|nr:hypothetical protein [Pelorhabdus rhamnosifermentans]MBU2701124.1 hypothetical protein [Pelorhabdus rhamnosifermentans]
MAEKSYLEQQKEIARNASVIANEPRAIYQSPFGGYAISTLNQNTHCECVWTTEDEEEPQKTPAQIEMAERIAKMENELNLLKQGAQS